MGNSSKLRRRCSASASELPGVNGWGTWAIENRITNTNMSLCMRFAAKTFKQGTGATQIQCLALVWSPRHCLAQNCLNKQPWHRGQFDVTPRYSIFYPSQSDLFLFRHTLKFRSKDWTSIHFIMIKGVLVQQQFTIMLHSIHHTRLHHDIIINKIYCKIKQDINSSQNQL